MKMSDFFSREDFMSALINYNEAVYPAQIIMLALALGAVLVLHSNFKQKNRILEIFLGLLWLWTGLVCGIGYLGGINRAVNIVGGIFALQGLFFLYEGFFKDRINFKLNKNFRDYTGYFLILFGIIIYPAISYAIEGSLERTISLGLPCPINITTIGLMIVGLRTVPKYILFIPVIWALMGLYAGINLEIYPDYVMTLSGLLLVYFLYTNSL